MKKRMGQHFLKDERILEKEARIASVKGKRVLEIGAGDGRLTEKILGQEPKTVYAVEKDRKLVEKLEKRFAGRDDVEIIEGDFLGLELPDFDVVVGNIPYYITSPIIFRLKDYEFERAVLIVQKEFAEKMIARSGERNYGRLSVTSQLFFSIEPVAVIPRRFFVPQPKVDSALIVLERTGRKLSRKEEDIIRALFSHRNKTVRNALTHSKLPKEKISSLGEILKRRVRTLEPEECIEIAAHFSENSSAS